MPNQLPPLPPGDTPAIHVQLSSGAQSVATAAQLRARPLPPDAMIWFHGLPGWIRGSSHPELGGGGSADDEQDRIFGGLVKASWDYFREHELAGHLEGADPLLHRMDYLSALSTAPRTDLRFALRAS